MNRKTLPVEIAMAISWLVVDLILAIIIAGFIAYLLITLVNGSIVYFIFSFIGAFIVQVFMSSCKKETRKQIKIIRYWLSLDSNNNRNITQLPSWAYDSAEQKSAMSLINSIEHRTFNRPKKLLNTKEKTGDLKSNTNKCMLDE